MWPNYSYYSVCAHKSNHVCAYETNLNVYLYSGVPQVFEPKLTNYHVHQIDIFEPKLTNYHVHQIHIFYSIQKVQWWATMERGTSVTPAYTLPCSSCPVTCVILLFVTIILTKIIMLEIKKILLSRQNYDALFDWLIIW